MTAQNTTRRAVLRTLGASAAIIAGAPMINLGRSRVFAADTKKYSHRAVDLVGKSLVIDMLGVVAINDDIMNRWVGGSGMTEKEIAEFRTSGINVMHQSVGVGGPTSYDDAMMYMASCNGLIARQTDLFARVDRVEDMERIKKQKKVGLILGLQNADQFRTAADVPTFYQLGMRCAQLTYNSQNFIGTGSTERVDSGVTDFGVEIINKMNEVGMLVDVSHCGEKTTLDAIEVSPKPIAITHSNCKALCPHPRLKTDEAIRKLAAKGGVIGISGVRMFVLDHEPTTLDNIVDHIDHVKQLVGIEHVGIGSDCDLYGYDDLPPEMQKMLRAAYKSSYAFRDKIDIDGFDHPRKVFDLTEGLIRRGYSDSEITAVLGGNFNR
jgi:membrane dipeptidase